MNYNPQLVSFETTDKIKLPGLLYQPKKESNKAAIWLHGNGSSTIFFSPERMNTIAKHLNGAGIAFFPFNNRGGLYIKPYTRKISEVEELRVNYGMTYELIKDCILDINAAIEYLKSQGYTEIYLVGHSTGANKICVYDYYEKCDSVAKYVLLAGGDDTGLYYQAMGKKKFTLALEKSREAVLAGKGEQLAPKYLSAYFPLSYQSMYDTLNPNGDYNIFPFNEEMNKLNLSKKKLFREFGGIKKPTLVLYGDQDEYCYGDVKRCVEILKKFQPSSKTFSYEIIQGADHSFTDKEEDLAKTVSTWLSK